MPDAWKKLAGKTAILTGAASGIGKGTALLFAQEGANLVLVDVQEEKLLETLSEVKALGVKGECICGDVSVAETIEKAVATAVERFGTVDIVFNNAGIMTLGPIAEFSEEQWDRVMAVNVKAMYLMIKKVVPVMLSQGGGAIVNTSSVNAILTEPNHSAYTTSKAAVIGLTKEVAVEFAEQGIRCNAVCPGWVETEMNVQLAHDMGGMDKLIPVIRKQQPLARMATVREVANCVLFLASDEASAVTGACLYVDGAASVSI